MPIFEGKNAGQHICAIFHNYVREYCTAMGWKWEPQAPQMPHMKNLDIAVFPAMPKRHSALLKSYSNKMTPADDIWRECDSVWHELESALIYRGFILMHFIATKVVAHKGTNTFLQTHDFHYGVCNSFADTPDGVDPKVNVLD